MSTDREKYPELFVPDRNIDPRTRSREVPMKILALSMPRTGTMSMQTALETLGFGPTIHGFNQWMHVQDTRMWQEGLEAKFFLPSQAKMKPFGRQEFDQLLGYYEIASDFPSIAFAEELIAAYPEAKVVIVERDVDAWYESFHDSFIKYMFSVAVSAFVRLDTQMYTFQEMTNTWVRGKFRANSRRELEQNARKVYRQHYETIRRVTPRERLLDFKLEDGWEPLCAFLGKDVPDVPFPRVNDRQAFAERSDLMLKIAGGRILRKGVILITVMVAAGAVWMKYSSLG
ncbi:hypothetical protein ASPZODRAFT_73923 [Penicilliopsis zonata CBS 506.65]|uniref:Sulfotransferase domain-containing protein n=1 Tax=Penicilliopsis zonata CBS 506.65 TaxID=1073090 RepID=A0A1L9S8W2_9EURO|nr:hypothetical protein ASPZODRAFT_73923 [Penicilliopsis zonata CBS 506.65]OJJ43595.1 hypothetical protein ASPZODRAFT_73923 [Penicilliopsis zonata CBS 506.65]